MTNFHSEFNHWPYQDAYFADDNFGNLMEISWNAFNNVYLDDDFHFNSWEVEFH